MDCQQFRDALDCYVDRELSAAASAAADAHRRECPSCNRAAARLLDVKAGVKRTVGATRVPRAPGRTGAGGRDAPRGRSACASRRRRGARSRGRRGRRVCCWPSPCRRLPGAARGDRGERHGSPGAASSTTAAPWCSRARFSAATANWSTATGSRRRCDVIGHHGAIATADGRIWNIVEQGSSAGLIHDESLLGRHVLVRGRLSAAPAPLSSTATICTTPSSSRERTEPSRRAVSIDRRGVDSGPWAQRMSRHHPAIERRGPFVTTLVRYPGKAPEAWCALRSSGRLPDRHGDVRTDGTCEARRVTSGGIRWRGGRRGGRRRRSAGSAR